jgi:hypothetical protein
MTRFLVLSLPRSRSFWTARFLSYERTCDHDPARFFADCDEAAAYLSRPDLAAADTGMGVIWRAKLAARVPDDVRIAVIHRPADEVFASLARCGVAHLALVWHQLRTFAAELRSIPGQHFWFDTLHRHDECKRLFEFCLNRPFDEAWWEGLRHQNLQCDRAAYVRDMQQNAAGMRALFGDIGVAA